MGEQRGDRIIAEARTGIMLVQDLLRNRQQVFRPLPQRRDFQLEFRQPVIEIIAEASRSDQFL